MYSGTIAERNLNFIHLISVLYKVKTFIDKTKKLGPGCTQNEFGKTFEKMRSKKLEKTGRIAALEQKPPEKINFSSRFSNI